MTAPTAHARICRELLLTAGTASLLLPMYIPTNWTGAPPDEPKDDDPVAWFGAEPEPERREVEEDDDVPESISDGFGNEWSAVCPDCGRRSMCVVRPGKVQCNYCG